MRILKSLVAFGMVAVALTACELEDMQPPPAQCEPPVLLTPAILGSTEEPPPQVRLEELMLVTDEISDDQLLKELDLRYADQGSDPIVIFEWNPRFECRGGLCVECIPGSQPDCTVIPPLPPRPRMYAAAANH